MAESFLNLFTDQKYTAIPKEDRLKENHVQIHWMLMEKKKEFYTGAIPFR